MAWIPQSIYYAVTKCIRADMPHDFTLGIEECTTRVKNFQLGNYLGEQGVAFYLI